MKMTKQMGGVVSLEQHRKAKELGSDNPRDHYAAAQELIQAFKSAGMALSPVFAEKIEDTFESFGSGIDRNWEQALAFFGVLPVESSRTIVDEFLEQSERQGD